MPVPVMVMPGPMPTVEFMVTVVVPTVVAPEMNEPPVRVWLVPAAVALVLRVTWLSASTERTVVPAAKLPLVRVMPGRMPQVLTLVTMGEPLVTVPPPKPGLPTDWE